MSALEDRLLFQIKACRLPAPEREYVFAKPRKWRFDFAWPAMLVAVECEGAVWTGGRHVTGQGFTADCEKYNTAALRGWVVLRVTDAHVKSGQALAWIERALA